MNPHQAIPIPDALDSTVPATQTVLFSFEGSDYEIALDTEHAEALRVTIGYWIARSHRTSPTSDPTPDLTRPGSPAAIRAWAHRHNLAVAARGPIPPEIVAAYTAFWSSEPR